MATAPVYDPPFSRSPWPEPLPGDAVRAPQALMTGPGRIWEAEPRWQWVEIRVGGEWIPGRLERWRLHQGSREWVALVRYGTATLDWGWFLYDAATVRQTPRPARAPGPR
ncbi:hypothetical protein [Kitasatospora aburaviensis]|uniref:Uncharacterized protein n=1 Tax=Kitasatospora aburaviensis TaxID=67265 RepID=A0ABW1F4Q9_9ACTN